MPVKKNSKTTKKQNLAIKEPKYNYQTYYRSPVDIGAVSAKTIFAETISLETILQNVRRDDVSYRALKKLSGDVFDKWFDVRATFPTTGEPHLALKRAVEKLNDKLGVKDVFKQAWELKKMLGFSLLALGWDDGGEVTEDPIQITDIKYIYPISALQVKTGGLIVDYRRNSPTYGQLIAARMYFQYNTVQDLRSTASNPTTREEKYIPASRFIHWANFAPGSLDQYGMSAFEPVFDTLSVKKNLDYSFGEAAFQFASRKYVLIVPDNVKPDYWDYVQKNFKDFDSLTTFVAKGKDHQVLSFGGQGQLDPRPYFDYYLSLLTTGIGVPRTILMHEGASGSEWVQKDYYAEISSIQSTDVEPMLKQFYKRLQELDLLPRGNIDFDWNKLIELDEREESFILSRLALGHRMQSDAVYNYINSGLAVKFTEDGWIDRIFVPNEKTKEDEFTLLPTQPEIPQTTAPSVPLGQIPKEPGLPAVLPTTPTTPVAPIPIKPQPKKAKKFIETTETQMIQEMVGDILGKEEKT